MQELDSETVISPSAIPTEPSAVHEVVDTTVECRVVLKDRSQQVLATKTETGSRVPPDRKNAENGDADAVRDRMNDEEGMGYFAGDPRDVRNEQQPLLFYMKSGDIYTALLS